MKTVRSAASQAHRFTGDTPRPAARFALLGAAALLTIAALAALLKLWQALPFAEVQTRGPAALATLQKAGGDAPLAVQEGLLLAKLANQFTAGRHHPEVVSTWRDETARQLATLRRSQLGRLQQAAMRMLELEQAQRPMDLWWFMLKPFLGGLERASFDHFQAEVLAYTAATLETAGLSPGTAAQLAYGRQRFPHGPFLEYFVRRLEAAGDQAARQDPSGPESCRLIVQGLLRQWILAPGPAELRVLAARLLAEDLERRGRGPATASATQADQGVPAQSAVPSNLAADLRAWVARYRASVQARPAPVSLLWLETEPLLAPAAHDRLVKWLGLCAWLLLPLGVFTVAGLACGWYWALGAARSWNWRAAFLYGGLVTLAMLVGGTVWVNAAYHQLYAEFRGAERTTVLLPHEWISAGLALAGLLLAVLLPLRRPAPAPLPVMARKLGLSATSPKASPTGPASRPRLARLAAIAAAAWLLLAVALLACAKFAERSRANFEREVAASVQRGDPALADPAADRLLDGLRAWTP